MLGFSRFVVWQDDSQSDASSEASYDSEASELSSRDSEIEEPADSSPSPQASKPAPKRTHQSSVDDLEGDAKPSEVSAESQTSGSRKRTRRL